MALSIKNPEVDRLARELAEVTGENMTEAICKALEERLEKEKGRKPGNFMKDEIQCIQDRVTRLQRIDQGSDEDLIGYDEHGIPG
jgi:antitoxin VapB